MQSCSRKHVGVAAERIEGTSLFCCADDAMLLYVQYCDDDNGNISFGQFLFLKEAKQGFTKKNRTLPGVPLIEPSARKVFIESIV
jgi:hypothetical protein